MFSCTRYEMKRIMEGKAFGATRMYSKDEGCPHEVGMTVPLTSRDVRQDAKTVVFAHAVIRSIRPMTVAQFRSNKDLPLLDGFDNGQTWYAHFKKMYPGLNDSDPIFHVQFVIKEMIKA